MRVRLGPIESSSARAWVAYARSALIEAAAAPGEEGVWLPDDLVEALEAHLDTWDDLAAAGPEFVWEGELDRETAEYESHAFFRLANHLAARAEAAGGAQAPPESVPFYEMLVERFLDALDREGDATSEFSEHLRSFWPGISEQVPSGPD